MNLMGQSPVLKFKKVNPLGLAQLHIVQPAYVIDDVERLSSATEPTNEMGNEMGWTVTLFRSFVAFVITLLLVKSNAFGARSERVLTHSNSVSTSSPNSGPTLSASERQAEIDRLVESYNERFKWPEDQRQAARLAFIPLQEAMISKWRSMGALTSLVHVENDYDRDHDMACSVLSDEHGNFMALVYEQRAYSDDYDRSHLRVLYPTWLTSGVDFSNSKDHTVVRMRLVSTDPGQGGRLVFQVAANLKKKSFDTVVFSLERMSDQWILRDLEAGRPVRHILLEFWYSLFPLNGGVKKVRLDSRD